MRGTVAEVLLVAPPLPWLGPVVLGVVGKYLTEDLGQAASARGSVGRLGR